MIMHCGHPACKSRFQDLCYGRNRRVFNKIVSKHHGTNNYRCTVCCSEEEKKIAAN